MTNSAPQDQIAQELSGSEVRLLFLLSRPSLSKEQRKLVLELVPKVKSWPAFVDTALRKYTINMVYNNLPKESESQLPTQVRDTMRNMSLRMSLDIMKQNAAFDWFHENCIVAAGVEHIYVKGPALAARFYNDPMQRYYRDVDIVVPRGSRPDLVRRMLDLGCKVFWNNGHEIEQFEPKSERDLVQFLSLVSTPYILTPQGLVVELHVELDNHIKLFDTRELFKSTIEVKMRGHCLRTLPDPVHIALICFHHTSHLWSKLHWLADLDAILRHPEFDREALLFYARSMKIESTVLASIELSELTASGRHPSDFEHETPGISLLQSCIAGLVGDVLLEKTRRKGQTMSVLTFEWQQSSLSLYRHVWLRIRMFLRPSYAVIKKIPGGPRLFWFRYGIAIVATQSSFVWRRIVRTKK